MTSTSRADIDRAMREDELRARLAAIVDSSDDAIVSKTLEGVITSWNRGAQELFGYSPAEAIGQHIFLIVPDDRRAEEEDVLARLRRGEKIDHFETVRQAKDGHRISISLTVSPIRDASGRIVGASKVARDIGGRVAAEEALRRARAELEVRVQERTAELRAVNTSLRREIAERRRIEAERARLYTRLVVAEEEERRRIARELHDQLGQQLTALRLTLETLKGLERDDLVRQVESLQELARQLDQDVAFRVWELTPTVLNTRGLGAALNEYIATWSKRFRIHAEVRVPEVSPALPSELMATIYRSAQEVLNNVVKHAHATRVDVVLEPAPDHVTLIVEDNGVGFDPHDRGERRGFGLIGMRERAALVGGDFQVESAPGRGTSVRLRVPTLAADAVDTAQR